MRIGVTVILQSGPSQAVGLRLPRPPLVILPFVARFAVMNHANCNSAAVLLDHARGGSNAALGRLMGLYGSYLKLLVASQLGDRLRRRVSESDVVQETFFEAHRDFAAFRGQTPEEFLAWMRRILVNNLMRVVEQHLATAKRDVRREVSLECMQRGVEQSTSRFAALAALGQDSPSADLQRQEATATLAQALATLPTDYRRVIQLRHLEGLPFEDVAERMDRSCGAVRMLWLRAIKQLRSALDLQGLSQ